MITLTNIIRYPLKSCKGEDLNSALVTDKGIELDRNWALFDDSGQVVTGRTHPSLLDISVRFENDKIIFDSHKGDSLTIEILKTNEKVKDLKVFSYDVEGERVSDYANEWFSEYLDKSVKLLYAGKLKRPVLSKHGGKDGDIVSFADQAPILLVSTASLTNLNGRLDSPIPMNRFRPNLIVKGSEAFAEDNWKFIKIGECEFEVIQSCERCIFTTIDIETKKKDKYREPLKTLMKYRTNATGGPIFGVHIVPRKLGMVKVEDQLEVIE